MAEASDSSLIFFNKATPAQWSYVLSVYKEVLKLKAARRTKKGGPEELIRLDNWYQEELPKAIHSRKVPHITHEELVQVTKWKLIRGKFRPNLIDLVRLNTESAVFNTSKRAFRRIPNISNAISGLTNLKGVGPASASAVLAAAYPEHVPYMADESMLSTPGIESIDYTLSEYLNYAHKIKACSDRLTQLDPEGEWNPHKVELTLWTHYLAKDLKPSLLEGMPSADAAVNAPATPNGKSETHSNNKTENDNEDTTKISAEVNDEDSSEEKVSSSSGENANNSTSNSSQVVDREDTEESENSNSMDQVVGSDEPASKKPRI